MMPVILANKRVNRVTFNQANGALIGWNYTNSAWTVSGKRAIATPSLGVELFANGGFDADTNWTKGAGWTISAGKANHSGTAGTLSQAVGTVGDWIRLIYDHESGSTNYTVTHFGASSSRGRQHISYTGQVIAVRRQTTAADVGYNSTTNAVVQMDNASAKKITLSDMFATIPSLSTTATLEARLHTTTASPTFNQPIGVVGWLDSYTVPANFILAYLNITTQAATVSLYVDKCVGGVYTNLITSAVTYAANAPLKLIGTRSGGNLLLDAYYNGTQVGTQQTVSDAGIVSNTNGGLFSGSEYNNFSSFSVT